MGDPRPAERAPLPVIGDPVAPDGYRLVEQRRVLGSVVSAAWESPEGERLEWTSRGHRKGRPPATLARTAPTRDAGRRVSAQAVAPGHL